MKEAKGDHQMENHGVTDLLAVRIPYLLIL